MAIRSKPEIELWINYLLSQIFIRNIISIQNDAVCKIACRIWFVVLFEEKSPAPGPETVCSDYNLTSKLFIRLRSFSTILELYFDVSLPESAFHAKRLGSID